MLYPQEIIEEVRMGNDIVDVVSSYVQIRNRGGNYVGLCPFHKEKSPSFTVSSEKQMFYCFGCGAGGNVISFIMQMENYNFVDTLKLLADRIHYKLPEAQYTEEMARLAKIKVILTEIHKKAARYFYDCLSAEEGRTAVEYLDMRGVHPKIRKRFGLGYCPKRRSALYKYLSDEGYSNEHIAASGLVIPDKNGGYFDRFSGRLMFPIFDVQGEVIGFGGRILEDGDIKYLNSPETPIFNKSRVLYGLNHARKSKTRNIILVEGYMDVISLSQAGVTNACAALGTSFNAEHTKLLKKHCDTATLLFDSDEAGTRAALRAIPILLSGGLRVRVQQVTGAKDPDEYIKKYGAESFAELIGSAKNHIVFQIDCLRKRFDLGDTDGKVQFTNEAAKILAALDNAIERDAYIKEIAAATRISDEAVYKEVNKLINKPQPVRPLGEGALAALPFGPPAGAVDKSGGKGVIEAQKSLLNIISANAAACRSVKPQLTAGEMTVDVYARMLDIIYKFGEDKRDVYAAELLNYFETPEEQRTAADVFRVRVQYEDHRMLEQAVNDNLRSLKLHGVEKQIEDAGDDLKKINKLLENKRNIEKLYITISDG